MRATRVNIQSFVTLSLFALSNANAIEKRAPPPATIAGGWTYQGCYVDVIRTMEAGFLLDATLTNQKCTAYCASKGFIYAGTEYYQECYCGNTLAAGAAKVAETECSTACNGDANQPCGGPNRLTIYKTTAGPQTNPGVNGYGYQGCLAEGTTGRSLTTQIFSVPVAEMTVAKCVAACKAGAFRYAGVEYSGECYCGNAISNGGAMATSGCDMLCNGNNTEYCGGANRLNLYDATRGSVITSAPPPAATTSAPPPAATGPSQPAKVGAWNLVGCRTEATAGRALISQQLFAADMTLEKCSTFCAGFQFFGTEYTQECYCGNALQAGSVVAAQAECNMVCAGNAGQLCGGPNRLSVYTIGAAPPASSTSTPPAQPSGPSQPAKVGTWNLQGCRSEATAGRALISQQLFAADMTLEKCATFCTGFTYFGTEYTQECYCGNAFQAGSALVAQADCNMVCAGNAGQLCGGPNRLSVYVAGGAPPASSSPPATTTRTTTSAAPPAGTGFPTGWTAQGCWVDQPGRILGTQLADDPALTNQKCVQRCAQAGYSIAGTEWYTQCFCGNFIINNGVRAANQAECTTNCGGDANQKCGGADRMTLYSIGTPQVQGPPGPQVSGLPGGWTYQGCYLDNIPDAQGNQQRTFFWQIIMPQMTPAQCLNRCAAFGYAAAGLEYGQECYCGDFVNIAEAGSSIRPDTECNINCAGAADYKCGGGSRLSTYVWTGTPKLYEWSWPQAPAQAGSYTFLIGGVCIPLMTQESITGKVTFLEKWGTGPANSTGAYELDLSQIANFDRAWRTMHVKTDIFCSAGIVLPDKKGRQLNIGGWSGDSTYGVRLYTPDGSAGVKGTNDWEENVAQLSLQAGRWYPSAMIMANGSIFVIGGEVGSNGAAVPSIEVLPYTGTAPLYMDWLARTDPNNLYPFCAVLPGGGIFVAYWNEARILNEVTFATQRLLPNIPASVNDDTGGRTYPLEGTAVLLPQVYPYTAPLEILICGGSTIGPGWALDNCVSIQPEAANPTWVLERMPSRRVMSCMAPLPDGTYLIINGAKQGVAGFGLATNPNTNAVLYNPFKPRHTRMTIMANTTVYRLYHSEAITLLDGRVLVSGSDPEDGKNPQEYKVEVFNPPYLLNGLPRPTFTASSTDWAYNQQITVTLGVASRNPGGITASLLGAVSSTHGNSMGARTIMPRIECNGRTCNVWAPPDAHKCPPGWFQFFILDGGVPAVGVYVRIGGDPAGLGNWPQGAGFTRPGM